MRITDMIKVENLDTDEVLTNANQDQHERVRGFYQLAIPIVKNTWSIVPTNPISISTT